MAADTYELSIADILFNIEPEEAREDAAAGADAAVIGQSRALAALSLALGIPSKGYNIYIQGAPGTGRRTALMRALSDYTPSNAGLQDKVYVSNFSNPMEPRLLSFPSGKAREFKSALHELVEDIKRLVRLHEESEAFKERKGALLSAMEQEENRILAELESDAAAAGFQIVQTADGENQGTDLLPLRDGIPRTFEDLQAQVAGGNLAVEEWNTLRERYYALMDRMNTLFETMKRSRIGHDLRVRDISREMLKPELGARVRRLADSFPQESTAAWLNEMTEDVLDHLAYFAKERQEAPASGRKRRNPVLSRYGANILVDRAEGASVPVIFENRPTLSNLVGTIESSGGPMEDLRSAYLRIRGGSILKASGGILVLRAEDIVDEEDAWPYLKRVLQTGMVEIQGYGGPLAPPAAVKPEPIAVNLKVVLIGGESTYDILYQTDPDFQKLFKVCAEFDSVMDRSPESQRRYTSFLGKICAEEGLRPLSADGAAAVLEQSVRMADHRGKLSTRFSQVADLLREADWCASRDGAAVLDAAGIRKALDLRAYIHKLPEDKLEAMILSDEILLQLRGSAVGKANGLAVHDRGYYAYGIPVVVSARVAPGDGGVVNIEGESGLSGEIFDKAVLILSGYLRSRYARTFPLSITASVCFEQMYTPIDGDSATAVQLCAILSAISGVPLRQDLAMTGSVNQLGDMQPVGGIPEKIEGFHSICAKRGLTGSQGVVIPRRNMVNLVLSDAVEADIRCGRFHIYAVGTIDQALEVLTGLDAGADDGSGNFPEASVNGAVSRELLRMAEVIRSYET